MFNEYIRKYSPFSYNTPVNYDSHTGRQKTIKRILKQTQKIKQGKTQHHIITGKTGYGKTSTSQYIEEHLSTQLHTVYTPNKNNDSLEDLCVEIIETLLNLFPQKVNNAIKTNMFGQTLTTNDLAKYSEDITKYFPSYLEYICKYLKKPTLLIIDDTDELIKQKTFTDWYESINETITNHTYKIPIFFLLTCQKESLKQTPETFQKIFQTSHLDKLKPEEVEEFYTEAFQTVNMEIDTGKWEDNPYKSFVNFASGIPWLMQTIGEKVFSHAHYPDKITQYDIDQGLIDATEILYYKEIQPLYKKHFQDPIFDKIYTKIIKTLALDSFKITDFKEQLTPDELIFLEEYLNKAEKLELIKQEKNTYHFTNRLYSVYFTNQQ